MSKSVNTAETTNARFSRREFLRIGGAGFAGAAMLGVTGCGLVDVSTGDDYPSQEITFIVPVPAGSAPDSTARALAEVAEEELGETIVIQNRPGGGQTVGVGEVVTAEPNGYTIGFAADTAFSTQPQLIDTSYEGPDAVQPIIQVNLVPSVLYVNTDSDIETIDDFIERARNNPGEVQVGIPGENSYFDLQLQLLEREANIELDKIAFGAGEQVLPLVNGTIDATVSQPNLGQQYVGRGDLRVIAAIGEEKAEGVEAPLLTEAGYEVSAQSYEGIIGPDGLPEDRIQTLENAFQSAMESEQFQSFMNESLGIASYTGAEQYEENLQASAQEGRRYVEEFGWDE